jgi:hypothetical protein
MSLFTGRRPGPKGARKATGGLRQKVLALRAQGHSVTEIAYVLTSRQRLRRKPFDVDGEPSLAAEGFDRAQESLRPAAVDSGVRLRQRQKTVRPAGRRGAGRCNTGTTTRGGTGPRRIRRPGRAAGR